MHCITHEMDIMRSTPCVIFPFIPLRSVKSKHLRCWRACWLFHLLACITLARGSFIRPSIYLCPPFQSLPFLFSFINNIHICNNISIFYDLPTSFHQQHTHIYKYIDTYILLLPSINNIHIYINTLIHTYSYFLPSTTYTYI